MTDYDGLDVVDADGQKVGTVERTFVDGQGQAQYAEVKTGTIFAKSHLVPVTDAQVDNGTLYVPYTKNTIENSPAISGGDTVDSSVLPDITAYYQEAPRLMPRPANAGGDPSEQPGGADGSEPPVVMAYNTGDIRDIGDFIDVPIVDNSGDGPPVVKEILRIPKKRADVDSSADQQRVVTTSAQG
ncbi:MAG TPA: PRC-barrel domain-containing protein [Chloroflexota bacterium]|nr:PRC-barrel domain-containing protein [Chloroflexota bacterium]